MEPEVMHMPGQAQAMINRISLEEARKNLNDIIFVDARSATALSRNPLQVRGAIHVPVHDVGTGMKRLPHGRTIVTYCT